MMVCSLRVAGLVAARYASLKFAAASEIDAESAAESRNRPGSAAMFSRRS
jgi:hypothetical protein